MTDDDPIVARLRAAGCVFAEDEARLLRAAAGTPDALRDLVDRRVAGEPLEPLLGWAEFAGLRITVTPGVFVPRRRSRLMVDRAVAHAAATAPAGAVLVDLCCGTGAIGVAVAAQAVITEHGAADFDQVAVRCARLNVEPIGGRVVGGDLYAPLPAELRGRVDVLVANAPYVPTEAVPALPREARDHEPGLALDGGADGLDVVRRVIAGALDWLAPSGAVFVETSVAQAPVAVAAMTAAGLLGRVSHDDRIGATIVAGHRPVRS